MIPLYDAIGVRRLLGQLSRAFGGDCRRRKERRDWCVGTVAPPHLTRFFDGPLPEASNNNIGSRADIRKAYWIGDRFLLAHRFFFMARARRRLSEFFIFVSLPTLAWYARGCCGSPASHVLFPIM